MALTDMVIMPGADYLGACDALRAKHGTTGKIKSGDMAQMIEDIPSGGGVELPTLTNPGNADTMLYGYQLIDQNGEIVTGEIQSRTADNVIVHGPNVTVNAGRYKEVVRKTVDTATQATPSITVSDSGLITAKATQSAGYVEAGTKEATKQLPTKAGTTVTPTTTVQTAVTAGTYVTGDINVAAVPEDTGVELPELTNPGDGSKLLSGYQLIGQDGSVVDGEIVSRTASDLTASGATVTVPAGHYAAQAAKSVTTATQATPGITVSASGLITATATQSSGYVSYGTKQATKQLTTQAAKTVTPTETEQTAVAAQAYTTGVVKVAGFASVAEEVRELSGKTGTLTLDQMQADIEAANAEIADQVGLLAQIAAELEGKAAGGGGGDSSLPAGYVRCSYIRFENAQYVDTGIVPTQDTKIKILFTRELSAAHYMFGVASSDNTAAVTAYVGGSWRFGSKSTSKTITTNPDLVQCAVMDAGGIEMPNNSNTFSTQEDFAAVGSLLLGLCRNASGTVPSTPTYTGNISLFEMWSGNTLVRKLIPVVSGGTYRFWDEVSGEFFDSKTTTPLGGGNW